MNLALQFNGLQIIWVHRSKPRNVPKPTAENVIFTTDICGHYLSNVDHQ